MNLKHLSDKTLIAETKKLATQERAITSEILHHLKEIEKRKLFSELGYPSMIIYAIKSFIILNLQQSEESKQQDY